MQNDEISCVPTINEDLLKRAGIMVRGIRFGLFTNLSVDEEEPLKLNSNNIWTDTNELWSPEKHNLRIYGELEVRDVEQLYGLPFKRGFADKGFGIVPKKAKLGFVLEWVSTCRDVKTNAFSMSGCIKPTSRPLGGRGRTYIFEKNFEPGEIKGSLTLSIHAYVETAAPKIEKGEEIFINETGYLFSPAVDEYCYRFQPDVVPFPIKEVSEPDKPLWWLQIRNMDDPAIEIFQESNISICINRKCSGFDSLLIKKNRPTLLMVHTDIIATAYFLLVRYLRNHPERKNYWSQMIAGEGLEQNTIPWVIGKFLRESEIEVDGVPDEYLFQRISEAMKKRLAE